MAFIETPNEPEFFERNRAAAGHVPNFVTTFAARPAVYEAWKQLNGAIKEVRRLSHDLRPPALDDLGLTAALTALSDHFSERTGIRVVLEADPDKDRLKPEASTALYRVAQEALNNIERHSGAHDVQIRLWSARGRARMTVTDNGNGFEDSVGRTRDGHQNGLGLRNMQERMAHFGGLLLVKSTSEGTVLTAMLPLSANADADKRAKAA